ncbi:MAG: glycosyltransferase [Pseudonocardiaceae bacterium]
MRWARRHWVLLVLLALGAALRVLTILAYQPVLLWIDSYHYLDNVEALRPERFGPIGYQLILNVLLLLGDLRFVTVVQHLLGLGIAVAIYVLLLRHGARRWPAALATAPLLLDAYQVHIEHNIMSEVWFEAILVVIVWVLTWRGLPTPWRAGVAGLLIGLSVIVRLVGVTMLVPAVVYLVTAGSLWGSRAGWRRLGLRVAAVTIGFLVVMAGYVGYFRSVVGVWGLTGAQGNAVLYGRAATIADCGQFPVGSSERALCPSLPPDQRLGVEYYMYHPDAPSQSVTLPPGEPVSVVRGPFGRQVLFHQPLDFVGPILTDFLKGFRPVRVDAHNDPPVGRWQFQTSYPYFATPADVDALVLRFGNVPISVNRPIAEALRAYQLTVGYVPGTLLGLALITGIVASLGVGRARLAGIRGATLLVSGLGITVLLTAAVSLFSWRYQLPGLVLLPMAGVLGITAFTGPLRRPGPRLKLRPPLPPYPDEVDAASVRAFVREEGDVCFAPVVVVIAAYNEEDGIGGVLDTVPSSCCGLPVDTLVVVDGCTDSTAEVARHRGARVCEAVTNRGQGAALRLGYALARQGGARYIVTTDADGQYDIDELPLLLRPLIDDEADFVTGSRVLGRQETTDPVRHLGVHVFARLASLLTRRALTDTSFGFRSLRAEITGAVTLAQAQYQASELLVGVIAHGYRVLEQPMTMRARSAGESKKGNNLVYGMRYARVLVGTWWRERSSRRAAAPNTSRSSSTNLTTKSRT